MSQDLQTRLWPLLRNTSLPCQAGLCSPEPLPEAGSCPEEVWARLVSSGKRPGEARCRGTLGGGGLRPAEQGPPLAVGDPWSVPRTADRGVPWSGSGARLQGGGGGPHPWVLLPSALSPVPPPVEMMAVFSLRVREPAVLPVMGWLTAYLLEQDCLAPDPLSKHFSGCVPWDR